MKSITPRQLKYLNILLTEAFGEPNRKDYLRLFYNVGSSKDLTVDQASQIIEKFVLENEERETNISIGLEKIYESQGQQKLLK